MEDVKNNRNFYLLNIFITIISSMGNLAPYLQAIEMYQLKSSHAVSLKANLISLIVGSCWLAYGIIIKVKPLIISNLIGLPGVLLIVLQIFYYAN